MTLFVANWKMHTPPLPAWAKRVAEARFGSAAEVVLCPPYTQLAAAQMVLNGTEIELGAQDCHYKDEGAFTGDISANMLKRAGCGYAIVGHSERRENHEETDTLVCAKAKAAHESGLKAIICVGETLDQRESGQAFDVIGAQIKASVPEGASAQNTVIAYEPVWAIGSGKAATPEDIAAMHDFIREKMKEKLADYQDIRILYGGSVKPENASEIFKIKNVDGALIGGASLKAETFVGIAKAA
jgi:triosephosphate isomerase